MTQKISLSSVDRSAFVERYGPLYEHSDWIAERAWDKLSSSGNDDEGMALAEVINGEDLLEIMRDVVESADQDRQLALICAHPDLAGRAAISGELTIHSTDEQASARLDQCSRDEYQKFQQLNESYKRKFNFPFIMAVRNRSRAEILDAFAQRIEFSASEEFRNALDNIHQIARLRLDAMSS